MSSDLFYVAGHTPLAHNFPSTSRTPIAPGYHRSSVATISSISSDESDEYTYDSSSSSSSSSPAKRYPVLTSTAPLRINRRQSSTSSIASSTSTSSTSSISPNRLSFRPLPKVPEAPTPSPSPSPASRPVELPETPHSARLRRLPVPPIRSPGGDDALLLARRTSFRSRPARPLQRSNTRTPEFAMTDVIDWDELGDILCECEED